MKKYLLCLAMCFMSAIAYSQSTQRATGDVNGDGKVDAADVSCLVNQILNNNYEYVTLYDGYTITVTTPDATQGSVTGGGAIAKNTSVTLTATPKSGYKFSGWYVNGTQVSTANPYTFKPVVNLTVVGKFEKIGDSENPGGNLDPGRDE